jgi:4-carboxymuconolactone decarboxylase
VRLPRYRRDEVTGTRAELFDEITTGPRARGPFLIGADGALQGPFNAMLASPAVGRPLQALGAALRYHASMPDRTRELVILRVAAEWGSEFERLTHEAVARGAGLREDQLEAIRGGREPDDLTSDELAALRLAAALCAQRPDVRGESIAGLTPELTFEISTLVGYYSMLALQLRVFEVDASPDPGDRPGEQAF